MQHGDNVAKQVVLGHAAIQYILRPIPGPPSWPEHIGLREMHQGPEPGVDHLRSTVFHISHGSIAHTAILVFPTRPPGVQGTAGA